MQRISITNPQNVIDGTAKKYYFRLRNTGGPKGDKGDKGDTGATGPQGPQGNAATVSVGSTTTLPVGYDATVTNTGSIYNAVLDFGIPQGPQGPQGAKGDKGDTGAKGDTGPRGPQGEKGTNATVYVGTTSTLAPGSQATVYNSGSDSNAVLNFGIPQGAKGDTGSQGPQGPAGQNFAPTVVAELPATGDESKLYLTPKAHTSQTATGNPITATITDGAGSMESFQLDGDTFQQSYMGKNLCGIPDQKFTRNGVTFTFKDGELTLNGTINGLGTIYIDPVKTTHLNGSYTINSIFISGTSTAGGGTNFNLRRASDNTIIPGSQCSLIAENKSKAVSIEDDDIVFGIYLNPNGAVFENFKVKLQIISGSTADYDFEPFVGGIPAPNPDYPQAIQTVTGEQTVTIAGKNYKINLSDNELEIPDGTLTNNGIKCIMGSNSATITRTSTNSNTSFIRYQLDSPITIHSGETFTLYAGNIDTIGEKTTTGTYMSVRLRRSNNTDDTNTDIVLGNINAKTTITATEDVTYTHFVIRTSPSLYPDNLVITPRLVIGQDNSIELCKLGTYQDYIWKDGEDWKVHKATGSYTLDGEESNWVRSGNTTTTIFVAAIASGFNNIIDTNTSAAAREQLKSDYFIRRNILNSGVGSIDIYNGGISLGVSFDIQKIPDITSAKAWVAANKPTIFAVIATPTDTTITDQALIAQLEAIRTASLQNGANTITNTATGSNLAGDMEIGYYGFNPTNRYDKFIWLDLNNNYEQIGE